MCNGVVSQGVPENRDVFKKQMFQALYQTRSMHDGIEEYEEFVTIFTELPKNRGHVKVAYNNKPIGPKQYIKYLQ